MATILYRADLIRARRAQLDLSLEQASKRVLLSKNTIVKIEAGTDPRTSTLLKITNGLGMNYEDLFKGLEIPKLKRRSSLDLPLFENQPIKQAA